MSDTTKRLPDERTRLIQVKRGCTRIVILVGPYAFKIPSIAGSWSHFLFGLLCNQNEYDYGCARYVGCEWYEPKPQYCPVLCALPGGWLIVMPRTRPLTREQFEQFDVKAWQRSVDPTSLVEHKPCSFGLLGERVVAVDYGGMPALRNAVNQ